jgi:hypothetical protein
MLIVTHNGYMSSLFYVKIKKKRKIVDNFKKTGFFGLFLCRLGVGRGKVSSMPKKSLYGLPGASEGLFFSFVLLVTAFYEILVKGF